MHVSTTPARTTMRFSEEETCKFVELYRRLSYLWDQKNVNYKNKVARRKGYELMVQGMGKEGFGIAELKQKIKNLRCTYNQECAKIQKSKEPGSSHLYVPNVKWFGTMHEIYARLKQNPETEEVGPNGGPYIKQEVEEEETMAFDQGDSLLEQEELLLDEVDEACSSTGPAPLGEKRPRQDSFQPSKVARLQWEDPCPRAAPPDQYDTFGQHIAAQLRELPLWNFIVLQEKIQCLVTSERLACLAPPPSPHHNSSSS